MTKKKKASYRIRNWSAYNKSLIKRGAITVWIDDEVIENWHPEAEEERPRGGQIRYSDEAIRCLLMLRVVFALPYRQTVGFAASILELLGVEVQVPDYTLLCKRSAELNVSLETTKTEGSKHIVVDSTGLKIYGEGEWKTRQHGYSKRRTWRKLHLGVNETTHEIEVAVLTEAKVDDAQAGIELLEQASGEIDQVSADGAYDKRKFYDACIVRGVRRIAIPPRRDAKIWQHGNSHDPPLPRDQNLRRIRQVGRKRWKQECGYHRRSLAETAVFRLKTIFGSSLQARTLSRQITEAQIRIAALNRMTQLGMPESYRVS